MFGTLTLVFVAFDQRARAMKQHRTAAESRRLDANRDGLSLDERAKAKQRHRHGWQKRP